MSRKKTGVVGPVLDLPPDPTLVMGRLPLPCALPSFLSQGWTGSQPELPLHPPWTQAQQRSQDQEESCPHLHHGR